MLIIMRVCGRVFSVILLMFLGVNLALAAPASKLIEFWDDSMEDSQLKIDHSVWDSILKKYVNDQHPSGINRFDYETAAEADADTVRNYLGYLQQFDPRQLNKKEQKAYWLNLYNAGIISRALNAHPIDSGRSISWRARMFKIAMQKMSLNSVEHGVLRPLYKDPRILFAVSGVSVGSGDIMPTAFTAENTEALLEEITTKFINHPRGAAVIKGELVLSKIFSWYKSDFGGSEANLKNYVLQYAEEDLKQKILDSRGVSYQYRWDLNKP